MPALSEEPIDVVIPYHEKDHDVVKLCIEACFKNIKGLRNIYIVSKSTNLHIEGIRFINEDKLFSDKLNKSYIEDTWRKMGVENLNLSGWLFQQFIKLGASYAVTNLSSNYVVVDADVVFLRPIKFFEGGKSLLSYGKERLEHDYLCCEKHSKISALTFVKVYLKRDLKCVQFQGRGPNSLFEENKSEHSAQGFRTR